MEGTCKRGALPSEKSLAPKNSAIYVQIKLQHTPSAVTRFIKGIRNEPSDMHITTETKLVTDPKEIGQLFEAQFFPGCDGSIGSEYLTEPGRGLYLS